jgi:tetratricopeptide (TPR) repeat protein
MGEEGDGGAPDDVPTAFQTEITGSPGIVVGSGNVQNNYFQQPGISKPTGPVVAGEIPQEPVAFQGRAELLAELRGAGPGVAVVTAVTGMRGVGKTQLAAAYARECVAAGWRLVAWVNAEDTALTLAGLAEVAARLGVAPADVKAEQAALLVRNRLEADGAQCLLVFDNAPSVGDLHRFVPAEGHARIVVTTTGATIPMNNTLVPVDVFPEREGLRYLAERTRRSDEAGARAVGRELGWLPLALAQAGAVIAKQHLPYETYLERLRSVRIDKYLTPERGAPYRQGVANAILLSLDAVSRDDQGDGDDDTDEDGGTAGQLCRDVLDLVAVLSPAGVSRSLLHTAAESGALTCDEGLVTALQVDEAVGRLADHSLLTFGGEDDATVSAHRLVMRVTRERAAHTETLAPLGLRACQVLEFAMGSLGELWQHRAAARDLTAQVFALHEHLQPHLNTNQDLETALLRRRESAHGWLNGLGDAFDQAIGQGRSLLADCERVLGGEHPDTLTSQNNLAQAYWAAGRPGEAIALHEATLATRERVQGTDHPSTLTSQNNLALAYGAAGRLDEAIALHEATLATHERLLGADHPNTLIFRNNLAVAYEAAGQLDEAVALHEATLATREQVLGTDHPDTLISRHNLAVTYRKARRSDEAIALHEAELAASERMLGTDHPSTLTSRDNLAVAYRAAERLDEAIALHEATLATRERVQGTDHPDTLTSRNSLAVAYEAASRLDQALPLYEAALSGCERVMGHDHPDTVVVRENLARAYEAASRTGGQAEQRLGEAQ